MRRKNSSPWQYFGMVIILGVVAAAGWWFFSPAFINKEVNEPLPNVVIEPSPVPAIATSPVEQPVEPPPQPATEPDKILSRGSFYNLRYKGGGEAVVYQLADGSRILRLQDFSVDNGPDLFVYLVPVDPVPSTSGTEIAGFYNLGVLKGNIGDQNYEIPADLDLSQFKSVVICCRAFAVPFSAAPLVMQ
ncbi:MAG: DM13 domain-containing protein [Chloroflexi bacterium]|nr:DM13 domain-containing protein [Chloroflexota bacterium]